MSTALAQTRVRDWMIASPPVITPETTVATALRLLREHRLPALPVWAKGCLVGLVTEKALLRFTPSEATTLDVYELREVLEKMTVARATMTAAATATPDTSLDEAAILMLRAAVDIIPVVQDGRLQGLLPWTALLEATVGEARTAAPR